MTREHRKLLKSYIEKTARTAQKAKTAKERNAAIRTIAAIVLAADIKVPLAALGMVRETPFFAEHYAARA